MIHPDKLYTKSAYHKEFGIDRVTLDRRIKKGEIKTLKVNGTILVRKD